MEKPKILYLDIETSRMVVEFETYTLWDIKRIDPKYIKKDWYITCAAWAWLDYETKKIKVEGVSVADFKSYKKDYRDDKGVVKALHKAISEADLIVGHNSDKFDIKKINYRVVKHGLPAIDLPPTVDTYKAAKRYMNASSNSLAHLAKMFGVTMKIDLPKGVMWDADAGCEKSLKKLAKYNLGDVKAGAELYFKLLPYIKNHPNLNRVIGKQKNIRDVEQCGSCGSSNIKKWGTYPTTTGPRQRLYCNDCGSTTKGAKIK